jgi:hypothetical protein
MDKDEIQVVDESVILVKFSPLEAELHRMAEESKGVTAEDFADTIKMTIVKTSQLSLRDMRTTLQNIGKALRDPHTAFNSKVLEKERELIAIIEPEEKRLKAIRAKADELAEKEARKALLPARQAMLHDIGVVPNSDEWLLSFDGPAFQAEFNRLVAEKNERDRLALEEERKREEERLALEQRLRDEAIDKEREAMEAERRAIEIERERIQHEKDLLEAAETARKEEAERQERLRVEEAERAIRLQKEEDERKERVAKEEAERIERERLLAEAKVREEQEALEARKKYQNFLAKYEYVDDGSFKVENDGKTVTLYKVLGTMKI